MRAIKLPPLDEQLLREIEAALRKVRKQGKKTRTVWYQRGIRIGRYSMLSAWHGGRRRGDYHALKEWQLAHGAVEGTIYSGQWDQMRRRFLGAQNGWGLDDLLTMQIRLRMMAAAGFPYDRDTPEPNEEMEP